MRCTKCQFENPAGMVFCGKCRTALAVVCPQCSFTNPPEFDFCGRCATALHGAIESKLRPPGATTHATAPFIVPRAASPIVDGERKTVTALFADIKDSTQLEQHLDPEEARAIIDPALALMIEAVRRYDGYVVQSRGDGIFALFGAPIAHEDHPQRALYAALRMQEELRRYSSRLVTEGGQPLQSRIGINTGEVVVRSIATRDGHTEYTPIGHATNLASRMEAIAPVDSIAVAESTYKLCQGYFALRPLGPTRVSGVSKPINVYEVTGLGPLRSRLQRSVGRGLAKFVGRDRELEVLRHVAGIAGDGRGQIAATVAEPGTGKSRLLLEFKARSQSGWMVLEAFSVSHGAASAYLPVIELLWNYFKISPEDDERTRREKVTTRVMALEPTLEDVLPYLFALLGIAGTDDPLAQIDGQLKKRRTLDAIKRILLRESLNQPLMLVFEDLHWIDEETQGLLNLLAESIGTAKILLLVTYRPEYQHQWGSKTYYTQLRLDPLAQESAVEMLSALLGNTVDLEPLKRMIIERTEGNPFFMEETVLVLLDDGALVREGTAIRLTKSLRELSIPPTVQALLAARIDRLPVAEKELLQTLAVLGREFPLRLVNQVVRAKAAEEIERMLADLQLAEFIYEQPTAGDVEYIFKHALTQEVAYNSLLIERRKILHETAGLALESIFADQLEDHLGDLAHHYSRSSDVSKAAAYLTMAAKREISQNAYESAARHLKTALELVSNLPETEVRNRTELELLIEQGVTLVALRGWYAPELVNVYGRARDLCKLLSETQRLLSVLFGLWSFHDSRAELRLARTYADEMTSVSSVSDDDKTLLTGWTIGSTQFFRGEWVEAHDRFERAARVYDQQRHRAIASLVGHDLCVPCLAYDAMTLSVLGFPERAEKSFQESHSLVRRLGHPFTLVVWLSTAAMYFCIRREFSRLPEVIRETTAVAREYGFTFYEETIGAFEIIGLAAEGKIEELKEAVSRSKPYSAASSELGGTWARSALAEALANLGRVRTAAALWSSASEMMQRNDERYAEPEIHRIRGLLALKQIRGREHSALEMQASHEEAERAFRDAIESARGQGAKLYELRAATSLCGVLQEIGKGAEGHLILSEIYNSFTEGFDSPDLRLARAALDELNPRRLTR
jgi:class 3 adenylate cyclase/tetratricopeptide (TPR) repeat protein